MTVLRTGIINQKYPYTVERRDRRVSDHDVIFVVIDKTGPINASFFYDMHYRARSVDFDFVTSGHSATIMIGGDTSRVRSAVRRFIKRFEREVIKRPETFVRPER